ncbi:MAG: hypothetical protein JWO13_2220 [Acidobacteriales bacterium]|nr:hypothetical protein [Terriglobales bacterium]
MSSRLALAFVILLSSSIFAVHTVADSRDWSGFQQGSRIEVNQACSGPWFPATITKVEEDKNKGPKFKRYTVKTDDGHEWSFSAPNIVAPCVRAIGGSSKERAQLPAPALGVYNCNYRGQVVPVFDFGLIDASTYRDYDGNRGTYRFDSSAKEIVFLTGVRKGSRARQETAKTFQILNKDGSGTGNYCPINPSRNINGKRL